MLKDQFINRPLQKHLKCILSILLVITYLLIDVKYFHINSKNIKFEPNHLHTRANAFLITNSCTSLRFNITKENIERVFPNYFHIYCFESIPLNNSRIPSSSSLKSKKQLSLLFSFLSIWTYEIPKYSKNNELEWSFIFEDDVNFIDPSRVSLSNYINVLEELMQNPEVQVNHGVFYLGICVPTFVNRREPLITKFSNHSLLSYRAHGLCSHAMGFTTKRAKDFWLDMSLYNLTPTVPIDVLFQRYCIQNRTAYYVLGSNLHWPLQEPHYGIAYQDRKRFISTIE